MDESFGSADYIEKTLAANCLCTKDILLLIASIGIKMVLQFLQDFLSRAPTIIRWLHMEKMNNTAAERFFNSFEITPFVYKEMKERKDTCNVFSSKNILVPRREKISLMYLMKTPMFQIDDDDENYFSLSKDDYKTRLVKNDTTGEAVYISFARTSKYEYVDSTLLP